ncbi:MAG: tRNA (cytidine(34)-2'-O)-methyltransferase [Culicoidibacterales bacterium]
MMIHIVLYEPEIPQNTGNIGRSCAATGTKLHLIEPLGFQLDEKSVSRAALDYWEHLDYELYPNWETFLERNQNGRKFFLTRYATKAYSEFDYSDSEEEVYFVFGKESSGIPKEIIAANFETALRIPMNEKVRSLNLSNCAMLLVYEALRQQNFRELLCEDVYKGSDWLFEK